MRLWCERQPGDLFPVPAEDLQMLEDTLLLLWCFSPPLNPVTGHYLPVATDHACGSLEDPGDNKQQAIQSPAQEEPIFFSFFFSPSELQLDLQSCWFRLELVEQGRSGLTWDQQAGAAHRCSVNCEHRHRDSRRVKK